MRVSTVTREGDTEPPSSGGFENPEGLIESNDPAGAHLKTGCGVCRASPDVGYCTLSEIITRLSLMAARLPAPPFLSGCG